MGEHGQPDTEVEAEIDSLLAEFNGDSRAAIAALLHDIGVLARGYDVGVSRGYVRRGTRLKVLGRQDRGPK